MQVNEIFTSIQGEGLNTGRPAIFLRLSGCNLSCSWCDTDHKANFEDRPHAFALIVKKMVDSTGIKFIVITGGEPTIQAGLYDLVSNIRHLVSGTTICLETNGTQEILPSFDFIAISPKNGKTPFDSVLTKANEIKLVVSDKNPWLPQIEIFLSYACPIWLQPEGNREENIARCFELAMKIPALRVGHQMHKIRGWK